MIIILSLFLRELLQKSELENNLIKKIFIERFSELLTIEENNKASEIMQNEIEKYLDNEKYLQDIGMLSKEEAAENVDFIKKLKIKCIYISGIKGIADIPFCKDSDKGCKYGNKPYLNIDKQTKIISLFGFNGQGKSSFSEALEFSLTGHVREADRRQYNKRNIFNYIKNINSEKGKVDVKLIDYATNNKINLSRDTEGTIELTKNDFEAENEIIINEINKEMNKVFIEKNRIDSFVLSKGKEQIELYGELLGFSKINKFIKKYWRNYSTEKGKELYAKENIAKEKLQELENKEVIESEIKFTKAESEIIIEIFPEESLDDKNSFINNLNMDDFKKNKNERTSKLKNEKSILLNLNKGLELIRKWSKLKKEIKDLKKKLLEIALKENIDENILDLYRKAEEIFEEKELDDCPLCGDSNKAIDEIKSEVSDYLKTAKKLTEVRERIKKADTAKRDEEVKLKELFKELNLDYNMENLNEKYINKQKEKLLYNESDNYDQELETIVGIEEKLRNYKKEKEEISKYKEDIEKAEKAFKKEIESNKKIDEILQQIKEFEDIMNNHRNDFIKNLLSQLSGLIKEYYNDIVIDNKIEEIHFKNKKDIVLDINFKGYKEENNDPRKILSEGQLKCFGLAILLALHEKSGLSLLVLDDIINAVDIDHRKNMINLIISESKKDRQIIITTYDKLFQEKLINLAEANTAVSYYFSDELLLKEANNNFADIIKRSTAKNDCRNALLYMRIALENAVYHMAEEQKINVPFKDEMRKYGLSQLLKSVIKSKKIIHPVKELLSDIKENYNYSMLNQEAHFWTETAHRIDHQTLEELRDKIIAIYKMKELNSDYLPDLNRLKENGIEQVDEESNKKLVSAGILVKEGNDYASTSKWDDIKVYINQT
jgi:DNA sulfur modification protein DndD